MRAVALADTHLHGELPDYLAAAIAGADLILHAGDMVTEEALASLEEMAPVVAVQGNCDSPGLKRLLPERRRLEVAGVRVGLVHQAAQSQDSVGPVMMAREMDVDLLIYGHIHRPRFENAAGRLIICPGSPTLPRMSALTVAELEIQDGRVEGRILPVGAPTCDYLKVAGGLAKGDRQAHPGPE
ncbi:MAG: metallophosphoesterase [Methanosarcinales archaeon]|nr:metallophosphoesterase [Methanosarcinales archaeon]